MFLERILQEVIRESTASFSVLMLTGPRQAGKTTLLRHMEPTRRFVTLDDLEQRTLAQDNPALFLERYPPPVLIDEFQYAPQLLSAIKIAVDEKRTRLLSCAGAFWLTGSQNFGMMEGVQESLAGRVAILKLLGMSLSEAQQNKGAFASPPFFERPRNLFETKKSSRDLFVHLLKGDKPEIWASPKMNVAQYYSSYIQTYLERDVRSQLGVRELGQFERFMRLLAARCGQLLNMASLAPDVGVTIPTIRSWLTILERSFQIYILQPYYNNLSKRQVKTPKIYFLDTGLVAHLLKWTDPDQTISGQMAGALFENWVVSEVIKSYWNRARDPQIYFWRTREGEEVDLVQESAGKVHALEIKLTQKPRRQSFQTLDKLCAGKMERGRNIILSPTKSSYPLDRETDVISAWSL